MRRRMLQLAVAAITVWLPLVAAVPAAHADSSGDLLAMINNARVSAGRPALVADGTLTAAAQRWSARMAANGAVTDAPVASLVPPGWSKLAENVGSAGTVAAIFENWRSRPDLYAIIVDPAFTLAGVAVVPSSDGAVLYASEFPETPKAAPTTTTTVAKSTTTSSTTTTTTTTTTTSTTTTSTTTPSTTTSVASTTVGGATTTTGVPTGTGSTLALGPVNNAAHRATPWIFVIGAGALALLALIGTGFATRGRPDGG